MYNVSTSCSLCQFVMSRGTIFPFRLHVHPAKTRISLRIQSVWYESSQGTLSVPKDQRMDGENWSLGNAVIRLALSSITKSTSYSISFENKLKVSHARCIWAHGQKTYLRAWAPSEDSDQSAHSRSLTRIVTGRILDSQVSSCGQRRL